MEIVPRTASIKATALSYNELFQTRPSPPLSSTYALQLCAVHPLTTYFVASAPTLDACRVLYAPERVPNHNARAR